MERNSFRTMCLIHLKDDVKRLGHLDSFSAFPFEIYMKTLKSFISKPEQPLQQIHRRYMEMQMSNNFTTSGESDQNYISKNACHADGPLIPNLSYDQELRYLQISKCFF